MDDIYDWLGLAHLTELTLGQKHRLLKHYKTATALLDDASLSLRLPNLGFSGRLRDHLSSTLINQARDWLERQDNHHIVAYCDPRYPQALKQITSPPLVLYLCGDPELLNQPQLAIIGSRKATLAGKQTANRFAGELVNLGLTITSGMALGIDSAAHQGALDACGRTIAVLGTGIDRCYPFVNKNLYQQISEQGLLVSEFALGSPPRREHFPRRNRLISGLSRGVLVVEAAQRSGSLITAGYALDQNREVFAIPGSIYSHSADGCLKLIQQGAKLTRNVNDIMEEFSEFSAIFFDNSENITIDDKCANEKSANNAVFALINDAPISFDKIIYQSGLTIDQLCSILLDMELIGKIEKLPGSQYIRTAPERLIE